MSLISSANLFLCKSGDEVRHLHDRCNLKDNCSDVSDEMGCNYGNVFFTFSFKIDTSVLEVKKKGGRGTKPTIARSLKSVSI